jgi:hypothetical protein
MSKDAPTADVHEPLGPSEFRDPVVRQELKKAGVWFSLALGIAAIIFLAQPLLLIFGGIVFASMLDGGTRLLGRVLPIGRGWRLLIVTLASVAFLVGTVWLAGVQLTAQAAQLRDTVALQINRLVEVAAAYGLGTDSINPQQIVEQAGTMAIGLAPCPQGLLRTRQRLTTALAQPVAHRGQRRPLEVAGVVQGAVESEHQPFGGIERFLQARDKFLVRGHEGTSMCSCQ